MEIYKYSGLPITPAIIELLIIDLINGHTLKRDEIVKKILDYHLSNGGLKPEAANFSLSVKKALSNMHRKGFANNRSYGFWEIQKSDAEITISEIIGSELEIEEIPTHITYGKGKFAVYLYYYPIYKEHSVLKGKLTWPCKIGRTDRDPLIRILSQASTALPEIPTIEFIIRTDNASLLESMIHSILTIRRKHIKDSPGAEWFETNPEEVIEFIKYIQPDIL